MKVSEETTCIATPGFAGFVPNLRYEYGRTYGNATRHILQIDPSLKQGKIQQDLTKIKSVSSTADSNNLNGGQEYTTANNVVGDAHTNDGYVWKLKNKYHTGDDRFSFPPVPGYTGFIPRSLEHFGQPYVEATNAALADFQRMLQSKGQLPRRVQKKIQERKQASPTSSSAPSLSSPSSTTSSSSNASSSSSNKPSFTYSASAAKIDDATPYSAPRGHPNQTFISGYTGFVPRLQKHFGEPYPESVRSAIEEFNASKVKADPYKPRPVKNVDKMVIDTKPIPGCTIFIPGSKYGFATTFGKTSEIAYGAFNYGQKTGKMPADAPNSPLGTTLPVKDLKKNAPIAGYRGHIPGRAFDM